ncbi:MAG: flagellar hook-basal body complex protein FliE [Candidatus Brocadiia bacterium]|nr:MAG: flagellar hook-basal body complex protein FliE [Candidatus Brocadiia bacterium]
MININTDMSSILSKAGIDAMRNNGVAAEQGSKVDFAKAFKAAGEVVGKVDDSQQVSNTSIKDLLTGKNEDITSIVSTMAKADMSFKVLVGVRNKLIEAYKQTMTMQV